MSELSDEINEIIKGVLNAEEQRQIEIKKLKEELENFRKTSISKNPKRFAEIMYTLSVIDPAGHDKKTE